jgi:hypothetical protein
LRKAAPAVLCIAALAVATGTSYAHPAARTTEQVQIVPGPPLDPAKPRFLRLEEGAGSPRVVRTLPGVNAVANRSGRRDSLAYFGQLTDFQLADEESPARVEFVDTAPAGSSATRPQEAFHPAVIDYSMRQLNQFTSRSPHFQRGGRRASMDFALLTGDQSDNQQYNETVWVRQLIEGGQLLDPNSGVSDYTSCSAPDRAALAAKPADEAKRYTGVQDYSDYGGNTDFYDPNQPLGSAFGSFPRYQGLMDRAQRPFVPVGLRRGATPVPTYATNGNHDGLVQGNEDAIKAFEDIAIGCFKPYSGTPTSTVFGPSALLGLTTGFAVPPDDSRRFVDRIELKRIYRAGIQGDGHGFNLVDPAENAASGFAASYYSFSPKPGLRFISVDTTSDGGAVADSANGNIDDPQWRWLQRELIAARRRDEVTVLFGHHPIRSLTSVTPDEAAAPCTGRYPSEDAPYSGSRDKHGHDPNPGCDLDPRSSIPVRDGDDLVSLLSANSHVVAYVAGHTHENEVRPCGRTEGCPRGGNWWEINTAATADWPQQHRLIEMMENGDGTLSLFGTTLDHASDSAIPGPTGDPRVTGGFNEQQLASIGRALSYNDPQADKADASGPGAEGAAEDRNVELLVADPRRSGPCARFTGRVAGKSVGAAVLGRKRLTNRLAFPDRSDFTRRKTVDRFCVRGGGLTRIGYPSRSYRRKMSRRDARRTRGRAVLALSTHPRLSVKRVGPGSSVRTMRRRFRGERRFRVGKNVWYLTRGKRARIVFKARGRRILEVGLADSRLTSTNRKARLFLRAFRR